MVSKTMGAVIKRRAHMALAIGPCLGRRIWFVIAVHAAVGVHVGAHAVGYRDHHAVGELDVSVRR